MREKIEIKVDPRLQFASIKATDTDLEFATLIVNTILNRIDMFLREKIKTSSGNVLELIEKRLEQISNSFMISEDLFREFREKNRVISASPKLLLEEQRLRRNIEVRENLLLSIMCISLLHKMFVEKPGVRFI